MRRGGNGSGATSSALNDDRRYQAGSRRKTLQVPATVISGRVLDAEDPGRFTRGERNVEALERMVKPVAERLDEGFLACPAIEKSQRLVARVEGQVSLVLVAGEKARCDVVGIADDANGFNVDSDFASGREGVHGDIIGMRYVESQVRVCVPSRERRFAAFPIHQLD